MKHNNVIPNAHFHKHWQNYVRTWFDQPARKKTRRLHRAAKAARVAPRPVHGLLRPVVHSQTQKYNTKVRAGRGFTLEELKAAGIARLAAPGIGIAVDHRRHNHCEESLQANVQRLKEYKARLVVFPRRAEKDKDGKLKHKKGDTSDAKVLKSVTQLTGPVLSISKRVKKDKARKITADEKAKHVYRQIRGIRTNLKYEGRRAKKAAEKAKAEADTK